MTPVTDPNILAQLNGGQGKPVTDPAVLAQLSGKTQPTVMQKIIASPLGRLIHDAVMAPLEDLNSAIYKGLSVGTDGLVPDASNTWIAKPGEGQYQAALAANRNTPGYAAARTQADKVTAKEGTSGFQNSVTAPFNPAVAGTVSGLFGGSLDAANAAADSQSDVQNTYAGAHPALSTVGGLVGGLAMGTPELPKASSLPVVRPVPTQATPDPAMQYVQRLMASSKTAPDAAGLQAAQVAAGGKPITSAEAIGNPAEIGLGALARRPGATSDALTGEMQARTAAAPQRMLSDYAAASGVDPTAAKGDLDSFVAANQAKAAPLYKDAYAANQNVASPAIDAILATPAGRSAMKAAATNMQNDGVLMGVRDPDLLEQARDSGQDIPWKGGVASGLKLQSLDYVKRALDGQISMAQRAGDTAAYGPLVGLKNRLTSALDDADVTAAAGPNSTKVDGGLYAQARAAAGDYLGAKEQFQNGGDFILNKNVTPQDLSAHLANLGTADAQAFKGGAANKLFSLSQNAKNGRIDPSIFSAPAVQQKLSVILGPQKAKTFLENMAQEAKMANFAAKRAPNAGSPSAEYLAAVADQDGPASKLPQLLDFGANAVSQGPVRATIGAGINKAKDLAAAYATRGMALPVRDKAGQLLTMAPGDLAQLLHNTPAAPLAVRPLQLPSLPSTVAPYGLLGSQFAQQQQTQ